MGETGTGDASTERPGHGLAGRVRAALLGLALAATCVPLGACLGFGDAPASARTQDPFEHEAPSHRAVEPSLDEARRSELGSAASRPDEARASADELARAEEADGHERAASIEAAHVRDEPRALPPTGAGNASEREEPTTIAGEGGDAGELDAEAGDAPTTGDLRLERGPGSSRS
ncbi:MAG: hypothetical protein IPJ77_01155 [Planctomycetes bacterium]|nr:hypothetical protein [Planctomycetota bacterium]